MVIEISVEDGVELIELGGGCFRQEAIPDPFSDSPSILSFNKGIIVGVPSSGLGLFYDELIEHFDNKTKKLVQASAKDYICRESKMNIRIDSFELGKIKERASRQGLRYSTFIKMVLHKYLTGQLVEK